MDDLQRRINGYHAGGWNYYTAVQMPKSIIKAIHNGKALTTDQIEFLKREGLW